MRKKLYKKGQKFGDWTLISFLGGGGNGEVWKCSNKLDEYGAIKLLKSVKHKPYARFLDETNVIENNSDIEGIVPMVDKYLPEDITNSVPFYVMPVAESAEKELKGKSIEDKIDAVLEICQTLKELHNRGISHRDIKPANLLIYKSKYSLADFGLVDYPDKQDISFKNEEIGAKWTMAPEMRRESSRADGLKADIYSLAKTLWIIITENLKGFDGQYSTTSVLELKHFCKGTYLTPIDRLLSACTDNDPNSRPSIDKFILILEDWKVLNKDFHERNQEQWFEVQQQLFPTAFPKRVIWEDINDIINVLKVLCTYDNLNHLFFPNGGGLDLEDARLSVEEGCIELDFQLIDIVKPKRLIFESFNYNSEWNYFRLEADELEPCGIYEVEKGEKPYEKTHDREEVTQVQPGYYEDYNYLENSYYIEDDNYERPDGMKHVTRWFRGSFVIFNKRSLYNRTLSTYDGRHNKMSTDEFREHIQSAVNHFKEEDKKTPIFEKLMDNMNSKRKIRTVYIKTDKQ